MFVSTERGNMVLDKITVTNLAQLKSDRFCPRCFWLKSRFDFKYPWNIFPKIFNKFDLYEKSFTESHFKKHGILPPWLSKYDISEIITPPGFGKFCAMHSSGVKISGVTDHIFKKKNGKLAIIDYKTASPLDDNFFDVYVAQLSIYKWLATEFGYGEVEDLALVYYDPITRDRAFEDMAYYVEVINDEAVSPPLDIEDLGSGRVMGGLRVDFRPHVMEIDPSKLDLDEMVARAKGIIESDNMSDGGCGECDRILGVIKSL